MKVALVCPYDFCHPGGVAYHVRELERQLTRMGHEVKVIAPASSVVNELGDRFIPIGKPRPIPASGSISRITISLRLASSIKKVLAREKFDIIHLHEPFMPMLCSAVLRFSDTVNIGTFHACQGKPGYGFGRPISTFMLKRRARKLHAKIAVSRVALEFASKHVNGHYDIIPNGIDQERFSRDVAPVDSFRDGKRNILFVGRLEKRKGVNYLLRAYQQVKSEIPDSRLIIVGPGTRLRKKYEKWVRKNDLSDVAFVGQVSYDDLPRYYKTADVCCFSATGQESFGIVLLEAMAAGKPVVASNIDGYATVLTHGVEGLLVPPKDEQALARALIALLKDSRLQQQMGERGRLKAAEYSWERIARKVVGCYQRVLSERRGSERLSQTEASLAPAEEKLLLL
ncbi:MAG: glycosyltransferase family 4 protein [Chloroflexi bacterium]|nr:glycosyltransferase family 4 protein [Chloroflexota bacterium]